MFQLLRSVFVVTLVLIAGLVAIIGLSYRNTNRFAYLFSHPDGTACETLCVRGIDPASLTLEQADEMFAAAVALRPTEPRSHVVFIHRQEQLAVKISETSTGISVGAEFGSDRLTLGELLTLVGTPEWIGATIIRFEDRWICGYVQFVIQNREVWLALERDIKGCISPSKRIVELSLYPANPADVTRYTRWQGFQTGNLYQIQWNTGLRLPAK